MSRLALLYRCLRRLKKREGALNDLFRERFGVRIRKTGIVFVTDDSPEIRIWRELGAPR